MPRLNRVFQGAVDLATALKQGVLQTALDDMNFININLLTQEENARYEHRIFHCLQIFDILTLALAPPREDTLFGIACQKICDLLGLLRFDLPQTVQRQVEQTKLRNTRLIMDAIYICNNRRTMFLWSNKDQHWKRRLLLLVFALIPIHPPWFGQRNTYCWFWAKEMRPAESTDL